MRGSKIPAALLLVVVGLACAPAKTDADQTIDITSGSLAVQLHTRSPGALNGTFVILVDGVPWFSSGDYVFTADHQRFVFPGNLSLVSAHLPALKSDAYGQYEEVEYVWGRTPDLSEWMTSLRVYTSPGPSSGSRSTVVFSQTYLRFANNTAGSQFPSLVQLPSAPTPLGTLEYSGTSCGFMVSGKSSLDITGGAWRGLVGIVPRDTTGNGTSAALVLGPASEVFANQAFTRRGSDLNYGLGASFQFAPVGFHMETLLVASSRHTRSPGAADPARATMPPGGINAALYEYGDYMLRINNKTRAGPNITAEVSHLGYSTTGAYFYNPCDCLDPSDNPHQRTYCQNSSIPGCHTYEDTLLAVDAYLREARIPVRSYLLDSWEYRESYYNGVWMWEDVPELMNLTFPDGLKAFHSKLGAQERTLWAHCGRWTADTPYRQTYPFTPDGLPQGPGLWQHLFSANREWGLQTIKQDHMREQMAAVGSAFTNVSVLPAWLNGMGSSASLNGINILYCCAPPSVHMHAPMVPAAMGCRSSPDYVYQAGRTLNLPFIQWAIGPDAGFHFNALGLLPYKDTLFTNTSETPQSGAWSKDPKQWTPFTHFHEPNPQTHLLLSVLSMASVTISDLVGSTNRTLVMMACNEDGLLLKPSRPVTALDAQYQSMAFGSWPGPAPPPPAALLLQPCNDSNPMQRWAVNASAQTISVTQADGQLDCLDIAKCDRNPGAAVHLFHNPSGCGHPPGTCDGRNELWRWEGSGGGGGDGGAIVSVLGACLVVDEEGAGGTAVPCEAGSAAQRWLVKGAQVVHGASGKCLTGVPIGNVREQPHFVDALPSEAEALWSDSYRAALGVSRDKMRQLAAEEAVSGRCGAPQGPLGEAYATHSTVGGQVWVYVVGVQLSTALAVTPGMLGLAESDGYVQVAWSEGGLWRQAAAPPAFSTASPVQLQVLDTPANHYPAQLHMLAPRLDGGWLYLGEVGKFVAVSAQRTAAVRASGTGLEADLVGPPGEVVEVGAAQGGGAVEYAKCTIGGAGTVTAVFPGGGCR